MLTKELRIVYDTLKEVVGIDGNYKVVEADDILEKFPEDFKMSLQELSLAVKELKDREYVKLKFFTLEEYCVQVLPKEEELIQLVEDIERVKHVEVEEIPKKEKVKVLKNVNVGNKSTFIAAFLGSMLGGIVVTIITVLVLVLAF